MEIPEILIIGVIIFLWLLSIKKFTKQFERIRTTHYREIPYSYHAKKINDKITIVKHETDSIIHAASYKTSRSKSLPSDQYKIIDDNETKNTASNSENSSPQYRKKDDKLQINKIKLQRKSISNQQLFISNAQNSPLKSKNSDSLSPIIIEFDASPKKLGSISAFDTNSKYLYSQQNRNLINPLLIPPVVRRSLLDLHRRSAEHLAMQMPQKEFSSYFHKSCDRVDKSDVFIESNV